MGLFIGISVSAMRPRKEGACFLAIGVRPFFQISRPHNSYAPPPRFLCTGGRSGCANGRISSDPFQRQSAHRWAHKSRLNAPHQSAPCRQISRESARQKACESLLRARHPLRQQQKRFRSLPPRSPFGSTPVACALSSSHAPSCRVPREALLQVSRRRRSPRSAEKRGGAARPAYDCVLR